MRRTLLSLMAVGGFVFGNLGCSTMSQKNSTGSPALTRTGEYGLLPKYNIRALRKRGILGVFTYTKHLDLNGNGKKELNELRIKRNFVLEDDINIAVKIQYGRRARVRIGPSNKFEDLHNSPKEAQLEIKVYNEKEELVKKENIKQEFGKEKVFIGEYRGRRIMDYWREDTKIIISSETLKKLPPGMYSIMCEFKGIKKGDNFKGGTIFKIMGNKKPSKGKAPVKVESEEDKDKKDKSPKKTKGLFDSE